MSISTAMARLTESPLNHRPAVFDALMESLNDSDHWFRSRVISVFIVRSEQPELAVPAALRLLARDGIDAEVRDQVIGGLRAAGYEPVSGPDGLRALPRSGEGPVYEMEP